MVSAVDISNGQIQKLLPEFLHKVRALLKNTDAGNAECRKDSRWHFVWDLLEKLEDAVSWSSGAMLDFVYDHPGGEDAFLRCVQSVTGIRFKWDEKSSSYYIAGPQAAHLSD